MKSFREFVEEVEASDAPAGECLAIYHFATDDLVAQALLRTLLLEALPRVNLGKGRSIIFHKAHIPGNQDHLHILVKGQKFAAINKDGSAHDRSHGVKLQRWVIDGAERYYPDFTMPADGLIEQLFDDTALQSLTESADLGEGLSPAEQRAAVTRALQG